MYSADSNQVLLKQLINRMAVDLKAAAAGILLLPDKEMSDFNADCAMLTFVEGKEN